MHDVDGRSRGVQIIRSAGISVPDMLNFPISVIGTKGPGSQYINTNITHTKLFLLSPQIELARILENGIYSNYIIMFCIEYLTINLHRNVIFMIPWSVHIM